MPSMRSLSAKSPTAATAGAVGTVVRSGGPLVMWLGGNLVMWLGGWGMLEIVNGKVTKSLKITYLKRTCHILTVDFQVSC